MRRLISKIGPIGVALLLASFLGYILLAYVARVLTPNEYSAFQASWGLIFGFGSAFSVVEQEISRQQANLDFDRSGPNNYPLKVCIISLCAVVPIGVAGLVSGFFERLSQELGSIGVYAVLIAVLGFIPQFVVRGVLVGREEHLQYAALLVIEPVLRLVAVAVFMYIALRESLLSYSIVAVATGSYAFSHYRVSSVCDSYSRYKRRTGLLFHNRYSFTSAADPSGAYTSGGCSASGSADTRWQEQKTSTSCFTFILARIFLCHCRFCRRIWLWTACSARLIWFSIFPKQI